MLILTRKTGETIAIGENIRVRVLAVKGMQVRIGIEAPAEVSIHREDTPKPIKSESGKKD